MHEEDVIWIGHIGQRGGEAEVALKALFTKYRSKLKRFLRQGISDGDAEDLVQETFIKVWQKADSYEGRSTVRSWIWSIGYHQKIDLIRRRSGDIQPPHEETDSCDPPPDRHDPGSDGRNFDYQICVKRGVHAFKEAYAERGKALQMLAEGWSSEEIAEVLQRSAGATREYLSQSRKVLEKFIAHCRELLQPGHHDTGGHHG